jgi:hypothetical protein
MSILTPVQTLGCSIANHKGSPVGLADEYSSWTFLLINKFQARSDAAKGQHLNLSAGRPNALGGADPIRGLLSPPLRTATRACSVRKSVLKVLFCHRWSTRLRHEPEGFNLHQVAMKYVVGKRTHGSPYYYVASRWAAPAD